MFALAFYQYHCQSSLKYASAHHIGYVLYIDHAKTIYI